jgi:hypothetical protein
VADSLVALLNGEPARFITLTLKHSDQPLKLQLDRLYKCFKKLRQSGLWTRHVFASAATLEIKRDRQGKQWHPHLHVLCKGKYVPHAELKREWHRVTGDSFICDIQFVNNKERAARYVAKYCTKPGLHEYDKDAEALDEAIAAMKGRRTILLGGDWKKLVVVPPTDTCEWVYISTFERMLHDALRGDDHALQLLRQATLLPRPPRPPPFDD